jgi:hypothetical protein
MATRNGMRVLACRSVVWATVAGLVLTMAEPPQAMAGSPAPAPKGISASSDATDFSAARRHRHYRRGGNAAGHAFMGIAIGTIAAIAAQQRREEYYDRYGYYGNGPGYYGGGPYYGRRYYYRPY